MSMTDLALRLAVLKVLADRVLMGQKAIRADVADEWTPGTRIPAKLPNGSVVGSVTLAEGSESFRVVDEQAFLEHVKNTRPGEVVETVRKSYRDTLLGKAKATGELPPGVAVTYGDPVPKVTLNAYATDAITEAWNAGELDWSVLPEVGSLPPEGHHG